jgi:hypothetical protein
MKTTLVSHERQTIERSAPSVNRQSTVSTTVCTVGHCSCRRPSCHSPFIVAIMCHPSSSPSPVNWPPCRPMQCPPGNSPRQYDRCSRRCCCPPCCPACQPAPSPPTATPATQPPPLGNISDIPNTDPSCPTHPLDLKFRIKYLQVRVIMHIQECGQPAYP